MRTKHNYILADKQKAIRAGFSATSHEEIKSGYLVLTERALMLSQTLSGDINDRLKAVGGSLVSAEELRGGVGDILDD